MQRKKAPKKSNWARLPLVSPLQFFQGGEAQVKKLKTAQQTVVAGAAN